jgi:hypothetical protein
LRVRTGRRFVQGADAGGRLLDELIDQAPREVRRAGFVKRANHGGIERVSSFGASRGMLTNARDQFGFGRELDQVAAGARGERSSPRGGVVVGRQHDDRSPDGRRIGTKRTDQGQPVDLRHDQVLEDERRGDLIGQGDRVDGKQTAVQIDVAFRLEQHAEGRAGERLVVNEENNDRPAAA